MEFIHKIRALQIGKRKTLLSRFAQNVTELRAKRN